MKIIFKREFVIKQHKKKKTRSEILKMEKLKSEHHVY